MENRKQYIPADDDLIFEITLKSPVAREGLAPACQMRIRKKGLVDFLAISQATHEIDSKPKNVEQINDLIGRAALSVAKASPQAFNEVMVLLFSERPDLIKEYLGVEVQSD